VSLAAANATGPADPPGALLTVAHPFDRPLAVGDSGHVEAMRTMNGAAPYCPVCFSTPPHVTQNLDWTLGTTCPRCGVGTIEMGEAAAFGRPSVFDAASLRGPRRFDWRRGW